MPSTGGEVMKRVSCNDGCKKEFILLEMATVPIELDIEFVGFSCPHCKKTYGHYQDNKIKRMQLEQKKLLQRGKRANGKVLQSALLAIDNKKKEIKLEMNRLKADIEGGVNG